MSRFKAAIDRKIRAALKEQQREEDRERFLAGDAGIDCRTIRPPEGDTYKGIERSSRLFPSGAPRHGHPRFYALLEELADLHDRKNHDYAKTEDPLSNLRMAESFGVEGWRGVLVRMSDKWARIVQLAGGKQPKNESLADSLRDLAVYSLLCLVLWEETLNVLFVPPPGELGPVVAIPHSHPPQ